MLLRLQRDKFVDQYHRRVPLLQNSVAGLLIRSALRLRSFPANRFASALEIDLRRAGGVEIGDNQRCEAQLIDQSLEAVRVAAAEIEQRDVAMGERSKVVTDEMWH